MWIGVVLLFAAYSAGLWGYCLVRGYCVSPVDIVNWNFPSSQGATAAAGTAAAAPAAAAQLV